jgi:hypothetical protein
MIQGLWVPFYTLHIFLTPQRSVEGRDVDSNVLDRVPVLDVILLRRDFDVFQLGYGQLSTVCVFSSFFIFTTFVSSNSSLLQIQVERNGHRFKGTLFIVCNPSLGIPG